MEFIVQEFDNQERVINQETRPGHKLAQIVAILLALTVVLALAIPQAEAAPVLPRPQSAEVLAQICEGVPAVKP